MKPFESLFPLILLVASRACFACLNHGFGAESPSLDQAYERLARASLTCSSRTAIRNVRIFDGMGMTEPQTVFIDNGFIVALSHADIGPGDEGDVDGTGKFLIPGLIDSHLHVENVPTLELLTSFGVTTAVNMACYNYTLCAALAELPGLASMVTTSQAVTIPGSPNKMIFDRPEESLFHPGVDDPATFVARQFEPGSPARYLKIISEPGGPSREAQTALVAAAHALGHAVMTHASFLSAVEDAVSSRADGLQHVALDGPLSSALVDRIKKAGLFVTPTLAIFRAVANDPVLRLLLSGGNSTRKMDFAVVTENVRRLHEAGVDILAGTDSAALMGFTMPYGLALHCELEYLVAAGLGSAEALRSATVVAAKRMGLRGRGAIEPGMRADLLLLDADPLANISNTRAISRVWAGGVEFEGVKRDLNQLCATLKLTTQSGGLAMNFLAGLYKLTRRIMTIMRL